jgi:hypothetical protein
MALARKRLDIERYSFADIRLSWIICSISGLKPVVLYRLTTDDNAYGKGGICRRTWRQDVHSISIQMY